MNNINHPAYILKFMKNKQRLEDNTDFKKSLSFLNLELSDNIEDITNFFMNFDSSFNRSFILGSVDYLRIVLREETLNPSMKTDLYALIYEYLKMINLISSLLDKKSEILEQMDLSQLENFF